ncbi:class I SAM-dependent methyltransferase [Candidatus Saccharibacteria bacterium]|nr:class I SAM-dependent methyltransferase [Candidatus Saccharibacteria bacterium]MBR6122917.1 class I SAM-dependent methyltransferase [Candidatus Saccharibacteria bacterium]
MEQVTKQETEEILRLAEKVLSAAGDFVELGCYKGETSLLLARLLKAHSSDKRLWLYDSFAGLPEKTVEDASTAGEQFKAGELFVSKREVVEKFKRSGLPFPVIKKGFFEDLDPAADLPSNVAFAFCDGDLYSSIKTSLKLVVPKLADDGIIVVHDYNNPELPGSSRAVDEFLRAHADFRLAQKHTLAILTRR